MQFKLFNDIDFPATLITEEMAVLQQSHDWWVWPVIARTGRLCLKQFAPVACLVNISNKTSQQWCMVTSIHYLHF